MYWTAFVAAGALAGFLIFLAQKMRAVGAFEYLLQVLCLILGLLVFGVSLGCGISVFTYRRQPSTKANHQ